MAMADVELTLWESITAALDGSRGEVGPYLTWLPDWLEPHAVEVVAVLFLVAAALAIWRWSVDLWKFATFLPRSLWRWVSGYKPPISDAAQAGEAAQRAKEVSERVERKVDDLDDLVRRALADRAEIAEASETTLPLDAVERAAAAIREVLQSNDPSKAEAQTALQVGDVQAAEDALAEAFGREEQAYARMDDETHQLKAKAARTAREAAALAATRSVQDALLWYQKAAALEPDDFATNIELARLHRLGGNLDKAFNAAEIALRVAQDDREHSVALNDVGDVLVGQGDLPKALENYRAAMEIAECLAQADASNTGLQRDLSVSHEKIGDVLKDQGDLEQALENYRASMKIRERLAQADASNTGLQRDLSVSHNKIGDVLRDQGNLPKALENYRASIVIAERLAQADISNTGLQRDLSVSHNKIGDVLKDQGDLGQALENYRASMEIRELLAQADASNTGLQRDLSVAHERVGDIQEIRGEILAAVEEYEKSLVIAMSLADRFPEHPQFQSDLEITLRRLSDLRSRAS